MSVIEISQNAFVGWHEEQSPDCKTPKHRRLTALMKRELVKALRTVALLAIFSSDSTTVSNIQSCLKSMSVMEPDLILYPILERAFPALEALVEVRTSSCPLSNSNDVVDSTYSSCHQGFGCCCASLGVPRCLLPRCKAPDPHPRTVVARY
jgi:hypothetical protein